MMRGGMLGGWGQHGNGDGVPVELRFVDLLLIVVATVMFMAVLLTVVSAFTSGGRPDIAPRITTGSAPSALVGQHYDLTLAAVGGDDSYHWRLVMGALPDGLTLDVSGAVHGIARRAQQSSVTVEVRDGQQRSARRPLLFTAQAAGPARAHPSPPRMVSPTALLPDATVGSPYRYALGASGTPPLRWRVIGDTLPGGLALTDDGALIGNPTNDGASDFAVTVVDSTGATSSQRVRLEVQPAPSGWWGTVLNWLWHGITYLGYLLLALTLWTVVFGAAPSAGHGGLIGRFRNSR
jgi:hypothetical protein